MSMASRLVIYSLFFWISLLFHSTAHANVNFDSSFSRTDFFYVQSSGHTDRAQVSTAAPVHPDLIFDGPTQWKHGATPSQITLFKNKEIVFNKQNFYIHPSGLSPPLASINP